MNSILIVEDSSEVLFNLVQLISMNGFITYEAQNGKEALEIAKQYSPDLIISDIMMPVMDGYGLIKELKNDCATEKIPLIFLSAKEYDKEILSEFGFSPKYYLTKPYKAKDLLDTIYSVFELEENFVPQETSSLAFGAFSKLV